MKEIPIFIASSLREFKYERLTLSPFIEMLNRTYKKLGVQLIWNRPELDLNTIAWGGSQLALDEYVQQCDVFVLIVGQHIGDYTRSELNIALERFRENHTIPVILPCFMQDALTEETRAFLTEIRNLDIGKQYIDPYENFQDVMSRIQMVLTDWVVDHAEEGDEEETMERAADGIARKIHRLQDEIKRMEKEPQSPENVAERMTSYAQIARMVQRWHIETNALLDYMQFLNMQHLYSNSLELGHWLENEYRNQNPDAKIWARLKSSLAISSMKSKRFEKAEQYFRECLEIYRQLARDNPTTYDNDVAGACNNLGILFTETQRLDEAETYLLEALTFWRRMVRSNLTAYYPYVARVCNNLGLVLQDTNRIEEAENYYKEALAILVQLAANDSEYVPDLATTYYNLGNLLSSSNYEEAKEEAEGCYQIALIIRRQLAEGNPNAHDAEVASIYDSLGLLLTNSHRKDEAERYFREALAINQRLAKKNPTVYDSPVARTCVNLGALLKSVNRIDEAWRYYNEALKIQKRLVEYDSRIYESDLVFIYSNMASLLHDIGYVDDAERYYQEALTICRKSEQKKPTSYRSNLSTIYNGLGNLLYEAKRYTESEKHFREALELRRQLVAENHAKYEDDMATTCNNFGLLLNDMDKFEEAEKLYNEALVIRRRLAKENPSKYDSDVAATCNNLGNLLSSNNRLDEAYTYYRESLNSYQRLCECSSPTYAFYVAATSFNLGNFEIQRGKSDSAKHYLREAITLFEQFPNSEQYVQMCHEKLASL